MGINMKIEKHRSGAPTLQALRKRAADLGLTIECDRDDAGWGYWLIGTGWDDETFSTCRFEVASKLDQYRSQLFNEGKISIDGWWALIPDSNAA